MLLKILKKVINQDGKSLDFVRNGDYLTIQNPEKNLQSVTVIYRGSCAVFTAMQRSWCLWRAPVKRLKEFIPVARRYSVHILWHQQESRSCV